MAERYSGDGRTVGSVVLLQAMLAHVIARHPDKEAILARAKDLAERMNSDAEGAGGNVDQFLFLTDVASGAADTVETISASVYAIIQEST
ncbi:hypothetical protein [Mesorhizobium carmichaelinearum]|uniref:hypothetical protein n=1 Tax=Mesorhizobium carmichaelinearum TaxID=1208188 RepID=UPI00117E6775|nr:hypothetical protein [Mesorhizobium carmichaelinearum]